MLFRSYDDGTIGGIPLDEDKEKLPEPGLPEILPDAFEDESPAGADGQETQDQEGSFLEDEEPDEGMDFQLFKSDDRDLYGGKQSE